MQEEHFWNKNKAAFITASGIGLILTTLFVKYSFGHPDSAIALAQLGNIKTYILSVMIWVMSSVLSFIALSKIFPEKENKILGCIVGVVCAAFFCYAGVEVYKLARVGAELKYLVAFIFYVAVTVAVYQFFKGERFKILKDVVIVIEILAGAVLWYFSCLYLNTFSGWSFGPLYNVFHTSSYIDSISNVYWGHPYYGLECDLYGHYGLFFIIPMKIFGANTKTIGTIMGVLAGVTFAAFGTAIHLSVKQFIVKFTAIVTLALSGMLAVSMYWQSFPHRLIFPALTILAVTLFARLKLGWKSYAIGLIIPIFAVIWNFETGILCAIAWGLSGGIAFPEKMNRIVRLIVSEVISVAVSCGGALALLNLYNALRHGPKLGFAELRGFAEASHHIDNISSPIELGNIEYIHAIILLMGCVLWGLWKFIIDKEDSPKVMLSMAVAVFGLGIITYYVNDSEGGPTVFMAYLVMAAAVIASGIDSKKDLYSLVKKAACIYACTALFAFGVLNRNFYKDVHSIKVNNCWNYDEFKSFTDGINASIAPDTKAGGYGTSAIFLSMGRDDGTDDFNYHLEDLDDTDHFLVLFTGETEINGYGLVNVFGYNDVGFGYYEKIQQPEAVTEE